MASVDESNHSRTSSFGVASSALLLSAVEGVLKAQNEKHLEGSFEKMWSANNLEVVSVSVRSPSY